MGPKVVTSIIPRETRHKLSFRNKKSVDSVGISFFVFLTQFEVKGEKIEKKVTIKKKKLIESIII